MNDDIEVGVMILPDTSCYIVRLDLFGLERSGTQEHGLLSLYICTAISIEEMEDPYTDL